MRLVYVFHEWELKLTAIAIQEKEWVGATWNPWEHIKLIRFSQTVSKNIGRDAAICCGVALAGNCFASELACQSTRLELSWPTVYLKIIWIRFLTN
jgi:hypothetical protein